VKKKYKKNGKLAAAAVKLDITVEVERLAAMEPELAELEMKSVAGQLGIPVDRLRKFVDRRRQKLLLEEHKKAAQEPGEHQAKKKSQADLLVDLAADGVELFHDGDKAFASVKLDDHVETWPVRSTRFRLHLRRLFPATHQKHLEHKPSRTRSTHSAARRCSTDPSRASTFASPVTTEGFISTSATNGGAL
jgi:hypothetical protein